MSRESLAGVSRGTLKRRTKSLMKRVGELEVEVAHSSKLAKERDFVYDRIQETKQELEKTDKKSSVYSVLKLQLGVMEEYKHCLGQRIKTLIDKT